MAEAQVDTTFQLNCPICLETFESPKVLACFHTFCEKCIRNHLNSLREEGVQFDTILCPVCRSPTPAPANEQTVDEWAAKLSTNSFILSILKSDQSNKDGSIYCQPCLTDGKEHLPVAYCVTCDEYHCHTCSRCHKTFKATKDHTVTVQLTSDNESLNTDQHALCRCSLHKENYTHFCSEHKEFCCTKCALKDHRKCNDLQSIQDFAKYFNERQDYKQAAENLEALKLMFVSLLENRSRNLESMQQQMSEIKKSVTEWNSFVTERVEKLKETTLNDLEQTCKREFVTLSDQIVECKSAVAAIDTSLRMLIGSTQCDNETGVFLTTIKVSQQLLKYLQKFDVIQSKSEDTEISFQRDKGFEEILQTLGSLGQVSRKASRLPRLPSDSSFEGKLTMVLPRTQPDSTFTFSAKIPGDTQICNICSVIFLPDERSVLCDSGNKRIKLFNNFFHFISSLYVEKRPRYLCNLNKGTVAVTADKSINIVSVTDTLGLLRNIDVDQYCYGIAFSRQNMLVCVGGKSIFIYEASYKIIRKTQPLEYSASYRPICVSPDGQHLHYKNGNRLITIDSDGKQVHACESQNFAITTEIAVDKRGIIYCCDNEANIVQVTPEGRQLGVLLPRDQGLQNLNGLCINDSNNTLLVFDKSEVKVFRLV